MMRLTSVLCLLAIPLAYAAPQVQNQASSSASGAIVTATATGSAPSSSATVSLDPLTTEETDALFQLHEDLVNIPSISDDEIECAEWLKEYLGEKGYYVERVPVTDGAEGRFNVFAYPQAIRDNGRWPEVLISSHIDTVSRPAPYLQTLEQLTKTRFLHSSPSRLAKRTAQPTILAEEASTPKGLLQL